MTSKEIKFRSELENWHRHENNRKMPWKEEKDPYKVWLSEIILQQTRVEQGLQYYLNFTKRFPRIEDLAAASEDEVLRLWQGLGYYSRARNLHFTAKDIVENYGGQFPNTAKSLLKLKGVGPYTAAAIASFVFKEKVAVVDGNVIRVLARYLGIDVPFDTNEGKKLFEKTANQYLDSAQPATYNQAIMDFGATICKPKKPLCNVCPISNECIALKENRVAELPIKKNRIQSKSRYFLAFHVERMEGLLLEQRVEKDIWKGLYQLPWIEVDKFDKNLERQIDRKLMEKFESDQLNFSEYSEPFVQQLSHQKIHVIFVTVTTPYSFKNQEKYLYSRNLTKFAFPKIFILYLQGKGLLLKEDI